jgi:hypothetical protein
MLHGYFKLHYSLIFIYICWMLPQNPISSTLSAIWEKAFRGIFMQSRNNACGVKNASSSPLRHVTWLFQASLLPNLHEYLLDATSKTNLINIVCHLGGGIRQNIHAVAQLCISQRCSKQPVAPSYKAISSYLYSLTFMNICWMPTPKPISSTLSAIWEVASGRISMQSRNYA